MTALDFKLLVKLMKSNGSAWKNCEDQGVVSDGKKNGNMVKGIVRSLW